MEQSMSFDETNIGVFRKAPDVMAEVLVGSASSKSSVSISTGVQEFDEFAGGLVRKSIALIASRPSMGKTAFISHLVMSASKQSDQPLVTAWFSLNDSVEVLARQILCREGNINQREFREGTVDQEVRESIASRLKESAAQNIYMDDAATGTVSDIEDRCISLRREVGQLDIVVIDDLQDMQCIDDPEELTTQLRALARDMNVAMVLVSNLDRQVELTEDRRPTTQYLNGYRQMRSNIDLLMMLYRPEVYGQDANFSGQLDIIIPRNLFGPTGAFSMRFNAAMWQIKSYPFADGAYNLMG